MIHGHDASDEVVGKEQMHRGLVIVALDTTHRGPCRKTASDLRPTGSAEDDDAGAGAGDEVMSLFRRLGSVVGETAMPAALYFAAVDPSFEVFSSCPSPSTTGALQISVWEKGRSTDGGHFCVFLLFFHRPIL